MKQQMPDRPWHARYHAATVSITPSSRTALSAFNKLARANSNAVSVYYFDDPVTFGEIDRHSDSLAVALQKRGIEAGDRIGIYMQNIPQVFIAVLAAWKCGAVIVPCNPMLRSKELAKILRSSGTRVLICQEDLYTDTAEAALPETAVQYSITTSPLEFLNPDKPVPSMLSSMQRTPREDAPDLMDVIRRNAGAKPKAVRVSRSDIAFMVFTSGTTGEPKGAMNTHDNVIFATSVYEHWIGLDQTDVILGLAPLFHVTGLIGHVTLSMLTGAPLALFYRFDANEACRLTEKHGATFTVSAVTAFIALLGSEGMDKYNLSSLTKLYTGGAPTPPSVLEDWHKRTGHRIQPMYGLTEATSPTHMTPHGDIAPIDPHTGAMSVGVPVFNTDVIVLTDSGQVAEPGEIGEFVIKGPQIVPGYWQKPDETARSITADGLKTGDVGFMDKHGWFYLVDRSKDMIVASGFKVWPREVEEVLYLHPAVREAAVVGIPDPYRGETIKAVVSLKPGRSCTPDELRAFAREHLAAYKYPRVVEIMEDLPKTTSGKIMRRLLQPTTRTALPMEAAESELANVTFPQLRAAVEARAVLEVGSVWLRLSRGQLSRERSKMLYDRLAEMFAQLGEDGSFIDREAFLAANKAYHAAVIGISDNEHLTRGFELLKLRQLYSAALKNESVAISNVVNFHESLTDAISGGDLTGSIQAILSWGQSSATRVMRALNPQPGEATGLDLSATGIIEDLSVGMADEQVDLAGDVDALVQAIDARAALEIGITQSLGNALTIEAQRQALVGRLRAFTPLVRGTSPAHIIRYIRADDAFHRVYLSLLRNPKIFDIYNAMDIPELMRRVLEVAPSSIREVFDDHKSLTNALRAGSVDQTSKAIADHANRVRNALSEFLVETAAGEPAPISDAT